MTRWLGVLGETLKYRPASSYLTQWASTAAAPEPEPELKVEDFVEGPADEYDAYGNPEDDEDDHDPERDLDEDEDAA